MPDACNKALTDGAARPFPEGWLSRIGCISVTHVPYRKEEARMSRIKGERAGGKQGRAPKVIAGVFVALMALLLVAFFGVNAFVRIVYGAFYADAAREFPIPGTDEGFIVQDLDELEDGTWLFSGYVSSGVSPVYALHADGTVAKISIARLDGSIYDGHGSGITSDASHVFLTDDEGFLVFDIADLQNAGSGATVHAIGRRALEFAPAFMNIEDGSLYLGTFYHPGSYESPDAHKMDTPGGDWNPAIMYAYPEDEKGAFGFADQAACAFSLPARIQGACTTDDGQMVLSQSYGLASSHLLVYDLTGAMEGAVSGDATGAASAVAEEQGALFMADGREVPLFFLDSANLVEDIVAPPMSEGIEWHEGKVYLSCESASNKYLFGKLYGAGVVYALSI